MSYENPGLTVYFDGSCPLCRAEISHYRGQAGADKFCFRDVSQAGQALEPDLTKESTMSRFHVRHSDGRLVSGAAAFVSVWRQLPWWQWAARISTLPGVLVLLELSYRLFLPARPALAGILAAANRWRAKKIKRSNCATNGYGQELLMSCTYRR